MARTEEVIRAQLEQLVSSYPSLAELQQNNSPSSVWSAVKNVIVQMVRLTEQQNDALIQERLTAEETGYIANREWYIARISERERYRYSTKTLWRFAKRTTPVPCR